MARNGNCEQSLMGGRGTGQNRKAKEGMALIRRIRKEHYEPLPADIMIGIIGALVTTHIRGGENFITFKEEHEMKFLNTIEQAIAENTNLTSLVIAERAKELRWGKEEKEKTEITKQKKGGQGHAKNIHTRHRQKWNKLRNLSIL
jgi:hypothetical protein